MAFGPRALLAAPLCELGLSDAPVGAADAGCALAVPMASPTPRATAKPPTYPANLAADIARPRLSMCKGAA
ncbi:hypothetical protein MHEL_50380 [Mycolicibacterium helvum]|uniref:Uncharacterized protein n=1 Tax=Mycolicibacterium helvum TaxID=1534349 RepID=A0A7I7TEK4_9MYCO|nr:hypothetical protein MHEL_50380 [Mycolicibacterium helvum]